MYKKAGREARLLAQEDLLRRLQGCTAELSELLQGCVWQACSLRTRSAHAPHTLGTRAASPSAHAVHALRPRRLLCTCSSPCCVRQGFTTAGVAQLESLVATARHAARACRRSLPPPVEAEARAAKAAEVVERLEPT